MLDILFTSYWVIALLVGFTSIIPTVKNIRLPKLDFLKKLFGLQLIFFAVVCNSFVTELNWGRNFPYHELTRIGGMLGVCLLILMVPRFINTWPQMRLFKSADIIFGISGGVLFVHYLITGAIYFATDYADGFLYFDGHRVLPAFLTFILLALAHSYTVIAILSLKSGTGIPYSVRKTLRLFAFGSLVAIPAIMIIDNLRWLFPVLWNPLPEERVIVVPAFYMFFNYAMVRLQMNLIKEQQADSTSETERIFQSYGLSSREAEVANLLAEGLAYKEIASKLFISLSTVQTHVKQIYRKTGTNSKMQLRDMIPADKNEIVAENVADA